VFDSLKGSLGRARFAALTSLILSSVVLANIYIQFLGFDNALALSAYYRVEQATQEIRTLERRNACARQHVDAGICSAGESLPHRMWKPLPSGLWNQADRIERSILENRIARAKNTLQDDKIPKAEIPTFGLPVSVNDLNVFCGAVLGIMALWAFFNMQQAHGIITDPMLQKILRPYSVCIPHMFSISNPGRRDSVAFYIYVVAFLPGFSLLFAALYDLVTLQPILPRVQGFDENWLWAPVGFTLLFCFIVSFLSYKTLKLLFAINNDLDRQIGRLRRKRRGHRLVNGRGAALDNANSPLRHGRQAVMQP
jgi:hypothetical protein